MTFSIYSFWVPVLCHVVHFSKMAATCRYSNFLYNYYLKHLLCWCGKSWEPEDCRVPWAGVQFMTHGMLTCISYNGRSRLMIVHTRYRKMWNISSFRSWICGGFCPHFSEWAAGSISSDFCLLLPWLIFSAHVIPKNVDNSQPRNV